MQWGDTLTWSQAAALMCAFFFACAVAYLGMTTRRIRRRRRGATLYNRGDLRPDRSARRNGTQAVPR